MSPKEYIKLIMRILCDYISLRAKIVGIRNNFEAGVGMMAVPAAGTSWPRTTTAETNKMKTDPKRVIVKGEVDMALTISQTKNVPGEWKLWKGSRHRGT